MAISLSTIDQRVATLENKSINSITLKATADLTDGFYREYSDGFKIMVSSYKRGGGSWGSHSVTFPKPMSTTKYNVILTPLGTDILWDYNYYITSKSTTGFSAGCRFGGSFWYTVFGYLVSKGRLLTSINVKNTFNIERGDNLWR